jgi:hypothetical protein
VIPRTSAGKGAALVRGMTWFDRFWEPLLVLVAAVMILIGTL